jgi:hypothetical protein
MNDKPETNLRHAGAARPEEAAGNDDITETNFAQGRLFTGLHFGPDDTERRVAHSSQKKA